MWVYRRFIGMPIGEDSIVWAGNIFNEVTQFRCGRNTIVGPHNVFLISGGIDIGNNVNLSGFSYFISQGHRVDDPECKTTYGKIVIEDDAWIATNSTIMPGVRIGRGAVVAAGSVVTKDIPPFKVVAGNPARVIKDRVPEVKYLLRSTRGIKWF